jgi:hypothetical protein
VEHNADIALLAAQYCPRHYTYSHPLRSTESRIEAAYRDAEPRAENTVLMGTH